MAPPLRSSCIPVRVRYVECDPMGVAHHSAFPVWFELGRTELYRSQGFRYRDLEDDGALLAVVNLSVRYRAPARYDDELELETRLVRVSRARLDHVYELRRDGLVLAEGATTLACIDRAGHVRPLPDSLLAE